LCAAPPQPDEGLLRHRFPDRPPASLTPGLRQWRPRQSGPPTQHHVALARRRPARLAAATGHAGARHAGPIHQALAQDLVALRRNPAHEGEALQELAAWAYQFSAQVTPLDEPGGTQGLLLEIGGSLRLFGGRHRLTQLLRRDLAQLGYHAELGAAPTPRGAWLIAVARSRGTQVADALSTTELAATLKRLPLPLAQSLGLDEATRHALQSLGLRRLGDLLALPRAELQQRFGPRLFDGLDRALGRKPDPQPPFEPPAQFVAGIATPGRPRSCSARATARAAPCPRRPPRSR